MQACGGVVVCLATKCSTRPCAHAYVSFSHSSWSAKLHQICGSHVDVSHSRQPLISKHKAKDWCAMKCARHLEHLVLCLLFSQDAALSLTTCPCFALCDFLFLVHLFFNSYFSSVSFPVCTWSKFRSVELDVFYIPHCFVRCFSVAGV